MSEMTCGLNLGVGVSYRSVYVDHRHVVKRLISRAAGHQLPAMARALRVSLAQPPSLQCGIPDVIYIGQSTDKQLDLATYTSSHDELQIIGSRTPVLPNVVPPFLRPVRSGLPSCNRRGSSKCGP
jgi:hypothetical protein